MTVALGHSDMQSTRWPSPELFGANLDQASLFKSPIKVADPPGEKQALQPNKQDIRRPNFLKITHKQKIYKFYQKYRY